MPKPLTIAIDGYSACGKSTTARQVARELGYAYLDTGAMYRATTLYFMNYQVNPDDPKAVAEALPKVKISFAVDSQGRNVTYLNGQDVENRIRTQAVAEKVSAISAIPTVRERLVAQQREIGAAGGVVAEGRDIGTNVFPDAEVKVFMTADATVRAHRRRAELTAKGQDVPLKEIEHNIAQRDRLDSTRPDNPLRQAPDARLLDTTDLTPEEQVARVIQWVEDYAARH